MSQKNTLFNYFGTPKRKENGVKLEKGVKEEKFGKENVEKRKRDSSDGTSPSPKKKFHSPKKSKSDDSYESSDNLVISCEDPEESTPELNNKPAKKFKRLVIQDSSDESDSESGVKTKVSTPKSDDTPSLVSKLQKQYGKTISESTKSEPNSPGLSPLHSPRTGSSSTKKLTGQKNDIQTTNGPSKTPLKSVGKCSSESDISSVSSPSTEGGSGGSETWKHLKFDFLKPDCIRDASGKRPNNVNYNPRTLYVPEKFLKEQTPAMRQWWLIKAENFDTVIFFKVGKFYELFHMDAVIGFKELGLSYMKGEHAHSGFPEIAFEKFAAELIDRGYKVGRVEQTETPEMMDERCSKSKTKGKQDRVVRREVCQLVTKGTVTYGTINVHTNETDACYLLAITELCTTGTPVFGVCFIDTSIGTFHFGQFADDRHRSRLRTLVAHYPPVQVLTEKGSVSQETGKIINCLKSVIRKDVLQSKTEFWSAEDTLLFLREGQYFSSTGTGDNDQEEHFPEAFKPFLNDCDVMHLSANSDGELAMRALGACFWYLKNCLVIDRILTLKQFARYVPVDTVPNSIASEKCAAVPLPKTMILDGATIKNLNVVGGKGSLLDKLDHCTTPFGKRLLRLLVCNPLCDYKKITDKQKAVGVLLRNPGLVKDVQNKLKNLPDLEKRLTKIHAVGSKHLGTSHPDSRAIFYENKIYSRRKITDFISTLEAFQTAVEIVNMFEECDGIQKSALLQKYTQTPSQNRGGIFPDLTEALKFFESAFNHATAKKEGVIVPEAGVDKDYDAAIEAVVKLEKKIGLYLDQQSKFFKERVTYFGTGKKAYQLEIPINACKRVTDEYQFSSQRKGFKRYTTSETESFVVEMNNALEQKNAIMRDCNRKLFENFSSRIGMWTRAVKCLAELDVLLSFARYAMSIEGETCVPVVIEPSEGVKPYVKLVDGCHPCIPNSENFVPNDTEIGHDEVGSLIVLTGPNMGGKSTLMRQLGLLVIMAQMGVYVPASSCELTLVDRIFTRIGARDDILAGESTFYIELSETATIFAHATVHSLVLVDELGRGTATYDGCAIACASVNKLRDMACRTIFSTHYHLLVDSFKDDPNVYFGHMACAVENEDARDPTEETVTFLYKFVKGACPKSYGFNAAKLGGIPAEVIKAAYKKSTELEHTVLRRVLLRKLLVEELKMSQLAELLPILLSFK